MKKAILTVAASAALLWVSTAQAAATPEERCEGGKAEAAGKYAACRAKADKNLVLKGDATKYSEAIAKCGATYSSKWEKLEQAAVGAGTVCPSTGDQSGVQSFIAACMDEVATATGGSTLPPDVDTCNASLTTCNAGTATAADVLAGKTFSSSAGLGVVGTAVPRSLPATGQTTSYGTGSDGDVQAGSTLSYTDNLDGTITDNRTGLMWEKKDDSAGIHDMDNTYTWTYYSYGEDFDGSIVDFLGVLNSGSGFAGHTDWRLPNAKELVSIVNYDFPYPGPLVDETFHKTATCTGCMDVTDVTCSCTKSEDYWSSTSISGYASYAWAVKFYGGDLFASDKTTGYRVRAVRGGL